MTEKEQRAAAKQFAKDWAGRGDEKQDTQAFWMSLLQKVYGVEDPAAFIKFELRVKLDHTSFIDAFIEDTHVLIEQKGKEIDLTKGYKQSDGAMLTPYGQARRYAGYLPHNMNPRWIVVCNFQTFEIHDMNRPNDAPEVLQLSDLEKECHRLNFLVDTGKAHLQKEMEVSMAAGEIVGKIYDAFYAQYIDPNEESLKSLNKLCVRLVFCLYAEDAGIFGKKGMFRDYLEQFDTRHSRKALVDLFRVLDTKPENRDKYLEPELAAFPYVNGGLFADEDIEIPHFTDEIRDLLLHKASEDFNWSEISPTIFGAVFESTLNPDTRRKGGMHYTSIENIHKVIDPLFLEDLQKQFDAAKDISVLKTRDAKLRDLQEQLSKLTFLDPACGSGNFLTETYLSLRRLENEILSILNAGQIVMDINNPIKVSIGQFYGIEINDFAVTVAKTALWIAESQMLKETEEIVHMSIDFLPLKSYANIVEGNALQKPWEDVIIPSKLSYIIGNPPFVGTKMMDAAQKADTKAILGKWAKYGTLDYVACWYKKAAEYIQGTEIRCAFVSTNSITQGEQVVTLWKPMLQQYSANIIFAYQTFIWDSEANAKAHVHCVIVGFTCSKKPVAKYIYQSNGALRATNINGYLVDAPNVFIDNRKEPISDVPLMHNGCKFLDDGNYVFTKDELDAFLAQDPAAAQFIRPYYGAQNFISGEPLYCIWLQNVSPQEIKKSKAVMERISKVREFRQSCSSPDTQKYADRPTLPTRLAYYSEERNTDALLVPIVSSERRKYIPIGYVDKEAIISYSCMAIPEASLYLFGVLVSNVHTAWMKTVCGRLKSDFRYSNSIVYNNFPWPTPTEEQKAKIEQTAQEILNARAMYPDCSLAELYGERMYFYPELLKAHQRNDRAVMEAYGFWGKLNSEPECVAELMKLYQNLVK